MESPNGAVRLSGCRLAKPTSVLGKNATKVIAIVEVDHCSCKKKKDDNWATNRITVQWKSIVEIRENPTLLS